MTKNRKIATTKSGGERQQSTEDSDSASQISGKIQPAHWPTLIEGEDAD